jgi:diguanylate cyclase (GGDEF)-like protein
VAATLRKRLRSTDIVARFGGEEFCILAVNMDIPAVYRIFEELRLEIEQSTVMTEAGGIRITVSIGIATQGTDTLDSMVKKADFYLYEAKESGRNMIIADFFDIFDEQNRKCRTG